MSPSVANPPNGNTSTISREDAMTRRELEALIKDAIKAKAKPSLMLRGKRTNATLQRLERLWDKKRSELMTEAPDAPLSNKSHGRHKRYSRTAWTVFLKWLTMPEGHYGTPGDPTRALGAAAGYVGCSRKAIAKLLSDKVIRDWSRDSNLPIPTWKLADLDELKNEHAGSIHPKTIAKELGWTEKKVLNAIRRYHRNKNGNGLVLAAHKRKFRPLGSRGGPWYYLTPAELQEFKDSMANNRKKEGYGSMNDLVRSVGAKDLATIHEVSECATLWYELGKLRGEEAITERELKLSHKKRAETHTWRGMTFDIGRFKELWNKILRDSVGVTILKDPLLPFGTRRPVDEIKDQLKQHGFVGTRFHRVKRLAGVTTCLPDGDQCGAIATRMPDGSYQGIAQMYERIDPKKKMEVINAREANERQVETVIKQLFSQGPLLVQAYYKALKERGLSRDLCVVRRAQEALGYESTRPVGFGRSPFVCRIKGQAPPTNEDVERMLARQTMPTASSVVAIEASKKRHSPIKQLDNKATTPPVLARAESDEEARLRKQYPGHTKKPHRRGPTADPCWEVAREFYYVEYTIKGGSRPDVSTAGRDRLGPGYCAKTEVKVKRLADEWADKFDPPLPKHRKEAARKFGNLTDNQIMENAIQQIIAKE